MLSTTHCQAAVLDPVPPLGTYLFFSMGKAAALHDSLMALAALADGDSTLAALGPGLVGAVRGNVPGLHEFEALSGHGVQVPSTPLALLCWLRGSERGELALRSRRVAKALAPGLRLERSVDAFRHGRGPNGHGRDLTGYEDGTENPSGAAARRAALVQGRGGPMDGSSFMAVQQWLHDFDAFEALTRDEQDHLMGRRRRDNAELADAPASAHVKRAEQESFEPPAFVLRRSMPWAGARGLGLMFVAFGHSFDAFERQMRRMAGLDDGVTDALFRISRPLGTSFFWCPPMAGGLLDLRCLDERG